IPGMFDPAGWCYAPDWHAAAGQCAHTVYPTLDQNFRIGDRAFSIKAGRKFHLSNSYRYTPAQIRACAAAAGFAKINILQHGTAALLVAQNGLSVATAPASSALLQN